MSNSQYPSKVLIAALDWGLGHATRIIPIVNYFKAKNCEVAIASSGNALALLSQYFDGLRCFYLPEYAVDYKYKSMLTNMLLQLPKIKKTIAAEHRKLELILEDFPADLIISDNRYGIYKHGINSVFITHQLQILPPKFLNFTTDALRIAHLKLLANFDQIWVPDYKDEEDSLAGKLSHIKHNVANLYYIGPWSRFSHSDISQQAISNDGLRILAMASGPKSARDKFEEIVLAQLEKHTMKSYFLRGLPNSKSAAVSSSHITSYNHLNDNELTRLIAACDLIICQSGYSSIMDLLALKKKAIFIPTKGQTEQEYLAKRFMNKKQFFAQEIDSFNLEKALAESVSYTGFNTKKCNDVSLVELALQNLSTSQR